MLHRHKSLHGPDKKVSWATSGPRVVVWRPLGNALCHTLSCTTVFLLNSSWICMNKYNISTQICYEHKLKAGVGSLQLTCHIWPAKGIFVAHEEVELRFKSTSDQLSVFIITRLSSLFFFHLYPASRNCLSDVTHSLLTAFLPLL